MKEQITPHLRTLIEKGSIPLRAQFKKKRQPKKESNFTNDPLGEEEKYSPVKGLVHKFGNRVLWKVSYRCAAHCQFCTRFRQIGSDEGDLSSEDIQACIEYIRTHPEINDVILSGGDPLFTVRDTLTIFEELAKIDSVKVIRIGTRLPIHSPKSFHAKLLKELMRKMRLYARKKGLFVLININHPDELTKSVLRAIATIQKTGAIILSQTVFLKGVNDNVETLETLFTTLYHNKILPYYIYRCDYVKGVEHFIVPFRKERMIMTELRKRLSGIAYPTYAIDVPGGRGKIPPPLHFWKGTVFRYVTDFDGNKLKI